MGYFPNGTAGDLYEEEYCARCVHENEETGCAVMLAHLLRNYEECNNKSSILHMLIPLSEDGLGNEQCLLFYEDGEKKRGMSADQKYRDWMRERAKADGKG